MDKTTRTSILGNVFMLAGGPVSWMSKKQKSVATSTMEAEYMALCSCAKRSQFLAQILRDMGQHEMVGQEPFKPTVTQDMKSMLKSPGNPNRPVQLFEDNQACLSLVKDPQTHERAKHIDIAYHYVRDLFNAQKIQVEFVGTTDMAADGMTKPKAGPAFQRFVEQIGLYKE